MDFKKQSNKMDEETLDLSGKSCYSILSLDISLKELITKKVNPQHDQGLITPWSTETWDVGQVGIQTKICD